MTLDEAIKHAEEVAEEQENLCKVNDPFNFSQPKWEECAKEHHQLAEWLKEYKRLKEQEPVLDKVKAEIEALPKTYPFVNHIDMYVKLSDVTKIIDKHKAENEGVWHDVYILL